MTIMILEEKRGDLYNTFSTNYRELFQTLYRTSYTFHRFPQAFGLLKINRENGNRTENQPRMTQYELRKNKRQYHENNYKRLQFSRDGLFEIPRSIRRPEK